MAFWLTNAPDDYDYSYVKTVQELGTVTGERGKWRVIEDSDTEGRFEGYQKPRYHSGMHAVYPANGPDAKRMGVTISTGAGRSGVGGVSGVSKQTRKGTRVRFVGSRVGYTHAPRPNEEGTVTTMPGYGARTYLPGPGGGLLYVTWDESGLIGISPNDIDKVTASRRSAYSKNIAVGPGRAGQKFDYDDMHIETTLHPIEFDGVSVGSVGGFSAEYGDIVFAAHTRGSKYAVEVRQHQDGTYRMETSTSGQEDGAATGYSRAQMINRIEKLLRDARDVDGINYQVFLDKLGLTTKFPGVAGRRGVSGAEYRFGDGPWTYTLDEVYHSLQRKRGIRDLDALEVGKTLFVATGHGAGGHTDSAGIEITRVK